MICLTINLEKGSYISADSYKQPRWLPASLEYNDERVILITDKGNYKKSNRSPHYKFFVLLLSMVGLAMPLIPPPSTLAYAATTPITKTDVQFKGDGGLTLHGTVFAPVSPGFHPGLVMVGGAGPQKRTEFSIEATALAKQGVAVLVYDKRTIGYSTFQRDYSVLANDAIGGVLLLRSQYDVNASMVGIFGVSEGGWVAPLAATRTKDIAYIVTDGAVGTTPVRQTAWAYTAWLNHGGVNGSLVRTMQTGARVLLSSGGSRRRTSMRYRIGRK